LTGAPASVPSGPKHLAGARFWVTAAAGWAVMGYGLRGLLHHHGDTQPTELAKFVVGGALLHDLVAAPVVLLLGVAVSRAVPASVRAVVQSALIVTASVLLFSYPLVRNYARVLHNPSSLPHNYTAGVAVVLGVVWSVALLAGSFTLALRRHRRSRR
jgi:glucan phosphoethanolaminetransferase (alkaline phosphatase superfamily)